MQGDGAALGKSCFAALEEKGRRGTPGKEMSWKAIQSGSMNLPFFSPLCSGSWMWVVTGVPEEVNAASEKKKNPSVFLTWKLDGQQGLTESILVLLSDLFRK